MDAALENYNDINDTDVWLSNNNTNNSLLENTSPHNTFDHGSGNMSIIGKVIFFSVLVISLFGAMGNGTVIWLLGFRMKRNPFSTYILNLAVADFGVLVSVSCFIVVPWLLQRFDYLYYASIIVTLLFYFLFLFMYSVSQFLLTAISVDRCVAVFFPLWHRCHKPPHLSTVVCVLIWFLSFLLTAMTPALIFLNLLELKNEYYQFFGNALLCLPVMMIATMSLFIKVCLKERQHQRGKILTIVLLTLLFFLLFAFPLDIIFIISIFDRMPPYSSESALLLACLNSSINPAIYILVGREWKSRRKENMKTIFQKVFKEEEGCVEETPAERQ